eukprot:2640999-Rhodomonas_salina.2
MLGRGQEDAGVTERQLQAAQRTISELQAKLKEAEAGSGARERELVQRAEELADKCDDAEMRCSACLPLPSPPVSAAPRPRACRCAPVHLCTCCVRSPLAAPPAPRATTPCRVHASPRLSAAPSLQCLCCPVPVLSAALSAVSCPGPSFAPMLSGVPPDNAARCAESAAGRGLRQVAEADRGGGALDRGAREGACRGGGGGGGGRRGRTARARTGHVPRIPAPGRP